MKIRPPLGTRVKDKCHASIGLPYPKEIREMVIQRYIRGHSLDTPDITDLRTSYDFPSMSTCYRWIDQYNQLGHVLPKRHTGNHRAERELHGQALSQLALFRCVKPKATIDEVRAYLYNIDPNVEPYSQSQIHRAETLLDLFRKRASTTSFKAYSPINLQKRRMYWTQQYPLGMVNIDPRDIIDFDQCALFAETTDRPFGKCVREKRCDMCGPYNEGEKLNFMMAVVGDDNNPLRWTEAWSSEGTNLFRLYNFLERIILDLAPLGRSFCFTMDNLNIHKNPIILNLIMGAGHRYVFRAPYWAVDGAIEYIFNTIHSNLQQHFNEIHDLTELENRIHLIVASMGSFRPYFENVGFTY
jgi:hypothetical protein